ncbi:PAN domain protein [Dictyocaulus viviparus]|uniref:PAN domain protein n=1 Tax=Dictyocaulus viviparus TaxID=29172 RepID=A0A0D8XTU3_DICVI|nr:PAN domain protein [Dictyocaulus viviparus]
MHTTVTKLQELQFLQEFFVSKVTPCVGKNVTTYLRSEGTVLMEFPSHIISDVTLSACADICTSQKNGYLCSSFMYDSHSRECSLYAEAVQPIGQSVLSKTNKSIDFFQKICVEAISSCSSLMDRFLRVINACVFSFQGESLCSSPYSFERFPQSLLIGYAMKV